MMTANERREEIIRLLIGRRFESASNLAREFSVTTRTIRTDIVVLTLSYPLDTVMGRHGGVKLADWYHPHSNILSTEQQDVLFQLIRIANQTQKKILYQILFEYGSPQNRRMIEAQSKE